MTGLFRQKNESNILLLLVYALALKLPMLIHPALPLRQPDDHYLYTGLVNQLAKLNLPPVFYAIVAFLLLFSQATLFNRIFNSQKMLGKPGYIPAMSMILLGSLFRDWNQFSAPLLINSLLIWMYYQMLLLYNTQKPGTSIFNIGLQIGLVTLLYQPAIVFILLMLFALYIMLPFRLRDWLIGLLGVTTPYYFLGIWLYITGQWNWQSIVPVVRFSLPGLPDAIWITAGIILLVLPFMIGGYFVQANLSKMLIQVRKNWSLLLLFLIISMLIIVINAGNDYVKWMLVVVPMAGFHAAAYFYPSRSYFPAILQWIMLAFAIYINYWKG